MAVRRQAKIFINGKEAENTIKGLTAAKRRLINELRNLNRGTEDYDKKSAELKKSLEFVNRELKDYRTTIRSTGKETDKTASSFEKLARGGIAKFAAVAAGAFAVDTIVQYGTELFKLGSEMELLTQKAETVWGSALPKVSAAARQNASDIGLTESAYIDAATAMGDLLKPLGFTTEEAAKLSTESLNLAGALSEWTGGMFSATEVNGSFQKALLGSREELERYGINIKQSDVNNRLAQKGLSGLTGELLKQAEAAATLELITEQSADAQRAFTESSGSLVRQQAQITARIESFREAIASGLIPVFYRLTEAASLGLNLFQRMSDPVQAATDAFEDQQMKVQNLERELPGLLDRYEELQGKSELTKDEQDELGKVIQRIGEITPTAITQIDEYGRVLSINAAASREALEADQNRLRFINQESISTIENEIEALEKRRKLQQAYFDLIKGGVQELNRGGVVQRISPEDITSTQNEIANLTDLIDGARAQLAKLRGEPIAPEQDDNNNETEKEETSPTSEEIARQKARAKELAEERQKQREKELQEQQKQREKELQEQQKQLEKLQEMVNNFREIATLEAMDADAQELERIRLKYEEQIRIANELEAKGIEEATVIAAELEALKQQAIQEAIFEQNEKWLEQQEELIDTELQQVVDAEEARTEAELEAIRRRNELKKSEQQKQIEFEQQLAQARMQMASAEITFAQNLGSQLSQIMGESAGLQKGFFLFEKTLAAAQVILELQKQTALISTKYAGILGGPFLAAAEIASARIRAATSLVTIAGTAIGEFVQRKEGGWLSAQGADDGKLYRAMYFGQPSTGMLPNHPVLIDSATGQQVLASERGREYFVSNESLKNPVVLNYVRAIDNIQRGGKAVPQYQEGGFTSPPQNPSEPTAPQGISPQQIQQMTNAITMLHNVLSRGVYAVIDDDSVIDLRNRTQKLINASGGVL